MPRLVEPYQEGLQNLPATNAYTIDNPKMWKLKNIYTNSNSRSGDTVMKNTDLQMSIMSGDLPSFNSGFESYNEINKSCSAPSALHPLPSANSCSKAKLQSVHHSSSVTATSALQATLIQCGKLSHADDLIANPLSKQVAKGKYIISPPPLSLFF